MADTTDKRKQLLHLAEEIDQILETNKEHCANDDAHTCAEDKARWNAAADAVAELQAKYISLVAGDDVNALLTAGRYRSAAGSITKAILNVPTVVGNNGFNIDVYSSANYPYIVQEITWCGYSTFLVNKIIRCGRPVDGAYQWGVWHQHTLTAIETAQEG